MQSSNYNSLEESIANGSRIDCGVLLHTFVKTSLDVQLEVPFEKSFSTLPVVILTMRRCGYIAETFIQVHWIYNEKFKLNLCTTNINSNPEVYIQWVAIGK